MGVSKKIMRKKKERKKKEKKEPQLPKKHLKKINKQSQSYSIDNRGNR